MTKKRKRIKHYYHSTFAANLDSIMREGLRPDIESLYPEIESGVYLTDSMEDAGWYAENYVEQIGEEREIVILKVSGLKSDLIEDDPYQDDPGLRSYRYLGIVPPKNIKVVKQYIWP